MTGGELQKRAKALWNKHPYELIPDYFIEIVDEAKKDFPKEVYYYKSTFFNEDEDTEYLDAIEQWKKKWFGGTDE